MATQITGTKMNFIINGACTTGQSLGKDQLGAWLTLYTQKTPNGLEI